MAASRDDLKQRMLHRRAVQAVIWGIPAVNYDCMYQSAIRDAGAKANQIVYWSRLVDAKNQTLTPNPDAIYLMPFIDTSDGPVVLEIPAAEGGSITGSVDDAWQTAVEDVGPAGVDKGAGGKYLILAPGDEREVPDGYIAMRPDTRRSYALLRSNLKSGSKEDVAAAVAYGRQVRLYPLGQADDQTTFVDASDVQFDAAVPYDVRFFEALDRCVQAEAWLVRDKAMIDTLKSIGIEKGKPFAPDAGTEAVLIDAITEAHEWLDAQYEAAYSPPFAEGSHWALPINKAFSEGIQSDYADPDEYGIDARGVAYHFAFFSAKHFGAGQFYLFAIKDADGNPLDGGNTYRLTVPANAPVRLYWSVTIYDRETHTLINGMPWSSRSSNTPGLESNEDGSVDITFGPDEPPAHQANWVPTNKRRAFEALFRFYGPEKPLFDKTWRLPDIVGQIPTPGDTH